MSNTSLIIELLLCSWIEKSIAATCFERRGMSIKVRAMIISTITIFCENHINCGS